MISSAFTLIVIPLRNVRDGPLRLIVFWYLLSTNNHFQLYGSKSCLPEHNGLHGHAVDGITIENVHHRIPRDKITLSVSRIYDEKSKTKSPTYTKIDFESKGETYYSTLCPKYIQKKTKRSRKREKRRHASNIGSNRQIEKTDHCIGHITWHIADRTDTKDEKNQIENSKYVTMRLPHHRHQFGCRRHHHHRLSRSIEACSRVEWLFCVDLCVFVFITHYIVHFFYLVGIHVSQKSFFNFPSVRCVIHQLTCTYSVYP